MSKVIEKQPVPSSVQRQDDYGHTKQPQTSLDKINDFFGLGKDEEEEVVLPASFVSYIREGRMFKTYGLVLYVLYAVCFLYPALTTLTEVYRAPFPEYNQNTTIEIPVKIVLAVSDESMVNNIDPVKNDLISTLSQREVTPPLEITWRIEFIGVRTSDQLPAAEKDETMNVHVLLVHEKHWTTFSATHVKLGKGAWSLVQWSEDEEKLKKSENRLAELITDVLVDVSHLDSIVKRDQRKKMPAWQIATLPLSAQKRLVWDSAPLATRYHVQLIHLHDHKDVINEETRAAQRKTLEALRIFAKKIESVTEMSVTSEHLWDFDTTANFLEIDVQDRSVLTHAKTELLIKKVEANAQSTLESGTILRFVVIEKPSVIVLDQTDEDTTGIAVAAWGAVLSRNEKTESMAIGAMRILLGMDAELTSNWYRPPVAVCEWELTRARLRVAVDSTMKAASAVTSLHRLTEQVTNIVINDDVAGRAAKAVGLLKTAVKPGTLPDVTLVKQAAELATSASTDSSLIGHLYFPKDQRFAVLLPVMLPIVAPIAKMVFYYTMRVLTREWL